MDELSKERIRFDVEIIKLLTVLFITTGGGGFALVLDNSTDLKLIVGLGGIFFAAGSGILAIVLYWNNLKRLHNDRT